MTKSFESTTDRRSLLAAGATVASVSIAGCGDLLGGDDEDILSWHAGGTGGTYYPLSTDFKNIIDQETDYELEVQSTGASTANAGSLADEDADFALIQNDILEFAYDGGEIDDFEDSIENLRSVATLYPETIHLVTTAGSDIESVSDLEGADVNTGDLGSGTRANAIQILEQAGLEAGDDFTEENADFTGAADDLRDGNVDAAFVVGGYPVGAVEELATDIDIDIVSITGDFRDDLQSEVEYFAADSIPGGTYEGVGDDVETVSVQAMIATHEAQDDAVVENVLEAIFENLDQISQRTDDITLDTAEDGLPDVPLHPGAESFFEDN